MRSRCLLPFLALALVAGSSAAEVAPPIAAASDLKFALDEIARSFEAGTGRQVRLVYGSSGNFFRQIAQDAPFELFLSADEDFVFRLAEQGRTLDRGTLYATGRIVLFVPTGSPIRADAQLSDLSKALADGRLKKMAIANPEHAPYGRAAKQALQKGGLWDAVQPHLVLGENVSQAAQFATSGSAQAGMFAYSLALSPAFAQAGTYALVPETWHNPLRQRMVLTRKATPVAREFYDYLQQPAARAVFRRYGFVLPAESAR